MSITQSASAYFEQVAPEWDALRAGYFPEAVREAAIARAYLHPEMVVADVGTGTGFVAAGLAPLVRQVYAVDGSPAMLDVARRNLAGFANVVYQDGDAQALPLEDGSVDAVFGNMVLHHCPDPAAAIAEMVRVLTPGGRLMLTDLDTHAHEWLRREMADEWLGFDRAQVRAWLRAAGLVDVIVDCTGDSCCAESAGPLDADDREAQISVFMATGTRRVAARAAVQAGYGARAVGPGGAAPGPEAAPAAASCCAPAAPAAASCCAPPAPAASCCAPASPATSCCAPAAPAAASCCAPAAPAASCCALSEAGPAPVEFATGYTDEQLAAVPPEAAELSLGCGNPFLLAALQPGETVLDIGSGGGIDCFSAVRQVGPAGRVIGLDMTPEMVARAQDAARRAGLANVSFRLGQAEALPVADGTVDVILSNCVINLCEDKGRVFEEAYRVLKEGGRLVVSDMVTAGPLPPALRGRGDLWAGCVMGALPEQEYVDLVRQAGFRDIEVRRSDIGGTVAGVRVYSALVMTTKGRGCDGK